MAEEDSLLPEVTPASTPQEIGAAAEMDAAQKLQAKYDKAAIDAFDIVDPSETPGESNDSPGKEEVSPTAEAGAGPTPAPASPFSPDLLRRAREAGLSDTEAKSYESPTSLERSLNLADRQLARLTKRQAQAPPQFVAPDPPKLPEPPKLDPEVFDPALVAAFEAQNKHYQLLVDQAKSEYQQQIQAFNQHREETEFISAADNFFSKFDKEVVGEGTVYDLDPSSPEYAARFAIVEEVLTLEAGLRTRGKSVPSRAALFEKASHSLYGKKAAEENAEKKIAERARNHEGQFISRPTTRSAKIQPQEGADFALAELKKHPYFSEK